MNINVILNAFRQGDVKTRLTILQSLESVEDEWLIELLKEALIDPDGWVVIQAIRLINQMRLPTANHLRQALDDSREPHLRWGIVEVIRGVVDNRRITALVCALNDASFYDSLRMPWVLGKSGDVRGYKLLLEALNANDINVRLVSTWLLSNFGGIYPSEPLLMLAHAADDVGVQTIAFKTY